MPNSRSKTNKYHLITPHQTQHHNDLVALNYLLPHLYTACSINEMMLVDRIGYDHIDDCQMDDGYSFTVGSIDGKHLVMNKPRKAGSKYHYYRGTFLDLPPQKGTRTPFPLSRAGAIH